MNRFVLIYVLFVALFLVQTLTLGLVYDNSLYMLLPLFGSIYFIYKAGMSWEDR